LLLATLVLKRRLERRNGGAEGHAYRRLRNVMIRIVEEILLYIALIACLQAAVGDFGVAAAVVIYCWMKTKYGGWKL
jgi:hypothetical protein